MRLCNGTRLIITQLTNKIIEGQITNSDSIADKVYIPRIDMNIQESKMAIHIKKTSISNKNFICNDN